MSPSQQKIVAPTIYQYLEFHRYFADFIAYQKRQHAFFSMRYLCKRTNIKSPSLFSWLASGKRLPTEENLIQLKDVCMWGDDEISYAAKMVEYSKARSKEVREALKDKLLQMRPKPEMIQLSQDANEFTCRWYNNAILMLCSLPDAKADPQWIVDRLGGEVDRTTAAASLDRLIRLGLLERRGDRVVETHKIVEAVSPAAAVREFHREMLVRAESALETQRAEERPFWCATVTLRKERIPEANEYLQKMIHEFVKRFCSEEEPDEVYHLATQLFRLSHPTVE